MQARWLQVASSAHTVRGLRYSSFPSSMHPAYVDMHQSEDGTWKQRLCKDYRGVLHIARLASTSWGVAIGGHAAWM